ncbi:nucleotidyltransferase family protein [Parvularcula dongshanensis]|uniref:CTP:molybdopterin cytidylyltransferase MocA n=1 Tax=Parvularcula dongshanensis TaxID=1173995 RepID=A0A840I7J7_9PROT|nr:NTP transferase domain-containing protein [Parvularcula dongshanensis]MBB4660078.1 CTP:molybdopterin cytidylyltransferase MocA [Parvularcula dongshanensis]
MRLACVLLAAGLSRRFGEADKLTARLNGTTLVEAAASAIRQLGPDELFAVTREGGVRPDGFTCLVNPRPETGLGASLALGAAAAGRAGADRLLVVLGDVPGVDAAYLRAVVERATSLRPSASVVGDVRCPPACFPACWFPRLEACRGHFGAGSLLRDLPPEALVAAGGDMLRDVDTVKDLEAIRQRTV